MKKFLNVLKGFIIGLAAIVPGVSGGTLAIILGIYEKLIEISCDIIHQIKKNLVFLMLLGIGVILAILLGSKAIYYSMEYFAIPTVLLFIGFIIGGIPSLFDTVKADVKKKSSILSFVISLVITTTLIIVMNILPGINDVSFSEYKLTTFIILFFVGFIAAGTMIIPGISGSLVLMLIGFYKPILGVVKNLTHLGSIGHNLLVLLPFAIGCLVGVIVFAKIINLLFKKFKVQTYYVIIAFVIASIIGIVIENFTNITLSNTELIIQIIFGVIFLCLGGFAAFKLGKIEQKHDTLALEANAKAIEATNENNEIDDSTENNIDKTSEDK